VTSHPSQPTSGRLRSLNDPEALRQFVRRIREGIYITSPSGEILDANEAFLAMFGVSSVEELRRFRAQDLVVRPEEREAELAIVAREGAVREYELRIRRADGEERTVLDTTYVMQDPESGETLYYGILVDITARKELEDKLREQSLRDPLTGCFNRRYLDEVEKPMRDAGVQSWGCIFIDIDHFKLYNDRFGHPAGDLVLRKMSRFLMREVRAEEAVIRVGGDEFLILLVGADRAHTERVAERLEQDATRSAPAHFSLGWACREDGESLSDTLRRADQNLLAVRVEERRDAENRRGGEKIAG
jgi:diguanylate cyclase (GGDEF)-like protein/PAS domain S-box-containing protein